MLPKQPDYADDKPFNWYRPRAVWKQMRQAIHFLSEDPTKLTNVRKLRFEIPKSVYIDTENLETRPFHEIRAFLTGLTALEHLHVPIPEDCPSWDYTPSGEPYPREYACRMISLVPSLRLGNVATLVIDQSMIEILEHCPRVQHLGLLNHCDDANLDDIRLEHYAAFAPNVSHMEARFRWYPTEIQCLAQAWPNLHHLGIFTVDQTGPELDRLLRNLCSSFKHLKVLKLAEVRAESFWAGGSIQLRRLFRASGKVHAQWMNASKELEIPWASFLREHAGDKLVKGVMESVFCTLRGLDECRIGDVVGARRVWGDGTADYSGEWMDAPGDDRDRQMWTVRFNWLGYSELCGPVRGERGGGWLLGPG
jgi:hypothetical protein